jgi:hypothetical protein
MSKGHPTGPEVNGSAEKTVSNILNGLRAVAIQCRIPTHGTITCERSCVGSDAPPGIHTPISVYVALWQRACYSRLNRRGCHAS